MFTLEVLPAGRHRLSPLRSRLRTPYQRSGSTGSWFRAAVPLLAVVLAAGCSSGDGAAPGIGGQTVRASGPAAGSLAGVCPSTVVIQGSWFSQVEHFAAYQLLGAGYTIDAARKRVTGRLVSAGRDTGVKIEIRAGGPAIGFQQVSAQMYADRSITLGMVPLDEAIQNSASQPVTGVMTPYDVDPLVLMWDPAKHPDFSTVADIGRTDTKVLFFSGERTYMDVLIGNGVLRASQVDGSYDGSPSTFVADRGASVAQGFATSEPWKWEHEVPAWGRPLSYALVADSGYPNYRNLFAVRTGEVDALRPCLDRLVPMLQRATVDFMADPGPTIQAVLSIIEKSKQAYTDSAQRSAHAVAVMQTEGLVSNGKNRTVGDFDLTPGGRVDKLIRATVPVFLSQRKALAPGLNVATVATNEFLDPGIGLPVGK